MGDFNAPPASVAGSLLNLEFPLPEKIENSKYRNLILKESIKIFNSMELEKIEKLKLKNLYSHYKIHTENLAEGEILEYHEGFPEFSNYTEKFKGFLDHILIKDQDFDIISLKKLPTLKDLSTLTKGLPFDGFPSDHLPLGAELSPT